MTKEEESESIKKGQIDESNINLIDYVKQTSELDKDGTENYEQKDELNEDN